MPGVYVLVGELNDDVKGTGLTKEFIQTAAEQEPRRVGIHVYDWDDPKQKQEIDDKNVPMLYTNVNSVRGDAPFDELYAAHIEVSLEEDVWTGPRPRIDSKGTSISRPLIIKGADIWHSGSTTLASEARISDSVLEGVKQLTDKFCNDFLKANPKTK
ncbi:hypothetical protein CP488_01598 [Chthonomonas calidirosea]|nr:hypothetical protein CP488_01598 [Chthonomonas calidirosea]